MKISRILFDVPFEMWYKYPDGDEARVTTLRTLGYSDYHFYSRLKENQYGPIVGNRFYWPANSNDKHFYIFYFEDPEVTREVCMFNGSDMDYLRSTADRIRFDSNMFVREIFEGSEDECLLKKLSW